MTMPASPAPDREPHWYEKPVMECFPAREALEHPQPVPDDIIGPRVLTEGGMWLIAGPPKVGKSDFLLSLLTHAAAGLNFLCFKVGRPLRVFYAQAELERPYLEERLRAIVERNRSLLEPGLENLTISNRFHFQMDAAGVEMLARTIDLIYADQPPDILVLDPFRNIYQPGLSGGDVNADLMAFFRERLEKLLASVGPWTGLILVHHTNKITGRMLAEDPMAAISGGGAILSYPSALTVMSKIEHEETHAVSCCFDLRYGPALPIATFLRDETGWHETGRHDMRIVRQCWGEMNDREQARKRLAILEFIYEEAREGRLYNAESLCDTLAGSKGLGSGKTIRALVKQYETQGFLRFIGNTRAAEYGLPMTRSRHGYLCVEGMKCDAAGDEPALPYLPTHYRCPHSGQVFELKKEDIHRWRYDTEDA